MPTETPKYLNSPEGPLYRKGRLLYGLYQARKAIADSDEVIVVEGYTDVLALAQAGTGNVVASMGTALTDAQIGLMMRFAKNVTFMFDADRAGTEAMLRSGGLARGHSLRPMCAVLPTGKDPADIAITGGQEAVAGVIAAKMPLLEFELRQALTSGDTSTANGRLKVFEEVQAIMGAVDSRKEREEQIPLLADVLRLKDESVSLLLKSGPSPAAERPGSSASEGRGTLLASRLLGSEASMERDLLIAAVCNLGRAATFLNALTPGHFADPGKREVFTVLKQALEQSKGDHEGVLKALEARAREGTESGPLFARLVMGADQGDYALAVLEELHLRLQERHLLGEISQLRAELEGTGDVTAVQRRMMHLEQMLQSVRKELQELELDV